MKNNNPENLNLSILIKNSIELAKVYIGNKKIKFSQIDSADGARIFVDENKFLAVLINLIKNAVESIDEEGEVEIETKTDGKDVCLLVSNNGKPISAELQEKIFIEGFTTKATGSGLGLYICKKTLEEQSASLRLTHSDENYTEFEITIAKA